MSVPSWRRCCEGAAAWAHEAATLGTPLVEGAGELPPESVHDIRVLCKRLRAAWQLVRSAPWPERDPVAAARAANVRLRDAARSLAGPREAEVLRKTIIRLTRDTTNPEQLQALDLALEFVRARHPTVRAAADVHTGLPALFAEEAQRWLALAAMEPPDALPLAGPVRCYRRALNEARRGIEKRDPDALHAWRKWVKYELYQLELLLPATVWQGRRRRLARLGEALGRHHDLCDLAALVDTPAFRAAEPAAWRALQALLARRFRRAEVRFVRRYARLYSRSERRYARRLAKHLHAAS